MNKKILFSGLVLLILILILVGVSFLKNNDDKSKPYLNIEEIVKTGDTKSCSCFSDISRKNQCLTRISDATIFSKAVRESNLLLCEKVSLAEMKDSCLKIVQGKINFNK